jgi:hypothetical protein
MSLELEYVIRSYLEETQRNEQGEIFVLLLEYLTHLFEDTEEPILLEDLTQYEIDDFINFYLEDNFTEDKEIQNRAKKILLQFLKFLKQKKYITIEEEKEWKEILN